jgi:hypothetical protein
MKRLFSILIFILSSVFVLAQGSETSNTPNENHTYFISTNSGVLKTPVGFKIGIIDRMGGYIGMRFGKGYKYEEDVFNRLEASEATLFAAGAGLIFPVAVRNTFKVHTFLGLGLGKWFDRPSQSGQTVGVELEGGLMLSYRKLMVSFGGNVLTGDGNSPKGDMNLGLGFKF